MASEKRPQRELDEALWDAAEAGDVEACKALKAEGANVNWTHPMPANYPGRAYQWTALHVASDRGRLSAACIALHGWLETAGVGPER